MDNFYTSTAPFLAFAGMQFAFGTTQKGRCGFPRELKDTTWGKKKQSEAGCGTTVLCTHNGRTVGSSAWLALCIWLTSTWPQKGEGKRMADGSKFQSQNQRSLMGTTQGCSVWTNPTS